MSYTYTNLLRSLARSRVLILDDWMCDEITVPGAQDLLEVLDDHFGYTSTIFAS